jgi:hypothetical protein
MRGEVSIPAGAVEILRDREKVDLTHLICVLADAVLASLPQHLGLVLHFSDCVDVDRMRRRRDHGERSS